MTAGPVEGEFEPAYAGFWMAGFEGADHVNGRGAPLDMARASGHLDRLEEDHRRAAQAGIRCVRESIGWRLCEDAGGAIDLGRALRIQASARRHGLQVLWTLMHYGLPSDLTLHDDAMIPRLARFSAEVARVLGRAAQRDDPPFVFTPVNEIGFLAWAASQPGLFAPPNNCPAEGDAAAARESSRISGYDVKRRLARAAIESMQAIRRVLPRSRFLHVEPIVHVVAPRGRRDLDGLADLVAGWQWQAWDLLCGRVDPAIGGRPEWLDLVGLNHYHSSQWEVETEARLDWYGRDARRRPMRQLLAMAWERYRRPLVVAETSHVGAGRAVWLNEIASEVKQARDAGVPVDGICLYPAVDRPDWGQPYHWHRSGLWHVETRPGRALSRRAEPEVQAALRAWQRVLPVPLPQVLRHSLRQRAPRVLVAFSHLRWEFVRHRARHLLQALADDVAGGWRVVFVEEPLRSGEPRLDRIAGGPQLDVLVPYTPLPDAGFAGAQREAVLALLRPWLAAQGVSRPVAWISTPMAWPLARSLDPARVVLDCADELGAFMGAPVELAALEAEALAHADLVVCAGEALAASRAAPAGPRLRLLPNGVDRARFRRPPRGGVGIHAVPAGWDADEAGVVARAAGSDRWGGGGPVLGYAGVVDERFDVALLTALADARPQWQFMIVGPVVKIAPATLPRRANVHWFAAQPYRLLPHWMWRWRMALIPFRQHGATVNSQPLKVLEALAAGLPVVATRLSEVESWTAAGVACVSAGAGGADAAPAFIRACEAALDETADQRERRLQGAAALLAKRDWKALARRLSSWLSTPALHVVGRGADPSAVPAGEAAPSAAVVAVSPTGAETDALRRAAAR